MYGWNKEDVGGRRKAKYGVACVGTMALYLFTSEGRFSVLRSSMGRAEAW